MAVHCSRRHIGLATICFSMHQIPGRKNSSGTSIASLWISSGLLTVTISSMLRRSNSGTARIVNFAFIG